jgi:predicted MFS family arabinose efflux permease
VPRFFGEFHGRALGVLAGCFVCQMGLGFGYAIGSLAPEMIAEFGWSRAEFSVARAPQLWAIALASPLVGAATLRFGGRAVLLAATALLGLAYAALAGVQSLWQLTAMAVVIGLAVAGIGDIAAGAVVAQWIVRARGLGLGIVYTGSNLGGWIAISLATAVLGFASWRAAVLAIAAFGLFAMLPFALATLRDRERVVSSGAGDDAESENGDLDVRRALRTPSFWILTFTLLTFWIYFLAMLDHFVLFLTDAGVPHAKQHFALAVGMGMLSKVAFGLLADRLPAKAALLCDFGLLAASSVLLLWLPSPSLLLPFVVIFGFSVAARDVVTPLIVVHCFGVRYLAQIYGVLMLTLLPGGTLGPALTGYIHDVTGSYTLAFQGLALLNLSSFALLMGVRDERRRGDPILSPDRAASAAG